MPGQLRRDDLSRGHASAKGSFQSLSLGWFDA
jgi:hypothetical protein